jgi:alkylation response protein AidB-like acyl-CoA dehydrogenase
MTAGHVAQREQFGRPLATFQAVGQRAADSYITTEALRLTTLQAAWRLDAGLDAAEEALIAAWWAAEGGHQVVLAGQHLHGGIGADIDYPVHRYFLWGSQLGTSLGSASAHLSRLGRLIAGPARPTYNGTESS